MIITRTPFRISFFGGGTDFPQWFMENGGSVLSTTIDKYCYITCRWLPPFFEHRHRIVYSVVENVQKVDDIKHPSVRAVLNKLGIHDGIEIHHDGDLPARSGLGSSSSFTVGLLNSLSVLKEKSISKRDLAEQAIEFEQHIIAENVGCQDQIAVAFGGLNRIDFNRNGSFDVLPVICNQHRVEALQDNLMLFFTGLSRFSSEVQATQVANIPKTATNLKLMHAQVDQALAILTNPNTPIDEFGALLHEAWQLKKSLSDKISTSTIDAIYQNGIDAGAIGGKILGAGGGGFILFFVPPEKRQAVKNSLKNLIHVPFRFERGGSQVVLYEPGKPSEFDRNPAEAGAHDLH